MLNNEGQGPPSALRLERNPPRLTLRVPARGPHRAGMVKMGISLLWLLACARWTSARLAAGGDGGAVVLSLPFWVFGLVTLGSATAAMFNSYRLELDREEAVLTVFPWRMRRRLRVAGLRVRFDQVVRGEADGRGGVAAPVLILESGPARLRLLEGFSEREQSWVQGELEAWLRQRET